jgi:hypothetical protein
LNLILDLSYFTMSADYEVKLPELLSQTNKGVMDSLEGKMSAVETVCISTINMFTYIYMSNETTWCPTLKKVHSFVYSVA